METKIFKKKTDLLVWISFLSLTIWNKKLSSAMIIWLFFLLTSRVNILQFYLSQDNMRSRSSSSASLTVFVCTGFYHWFKIQIKLIVRKNYKNLTCITFPCMTSLNNQCQKESHFLHEFLLSMCILYF